MMRCACETVVFLCFMCFEGARDMSKQANMESKDTKRKRKS